MQVSYMDILWHMIFYADKMDAATTGVTIGAAVACVVDVCDRFKLSLSNFGKHCRGFHY